MHALVDPALRTVAAVLDVLAAAAWGLSPVALSLLVLAGATVAAVVVVVVTARAGTLPGAGTRLQADAADVADRRWPDRRTRIAWCHPDAAGHVRPRGPGGVPAT